MRSCVGNRESRESEQMSLSLRIGLGLAGLLGVVFAGTGSAGGGAPEELWQAPPDGSPGESAGRMENPRGMATDPVSGEVYVADLENHRIDVFDGEGHFARAWGWGVADGSTEALQVCTTTCFKGHAGAGAGELN